jgi:hypothetical protein
MLFLGILILIALILNNQYSDDIGSPMLTLRTQNLKILVQIRFLLFLTLKKIPSKKKVSCLLFEHTRDPKKFFP